MIGGCLLHVIAIAISWLSCLCHGVVEKSVLGKSRVSASVFTSFFMPALPGTARTLISDNSARLFTLELLYGCVKPQLLKHFFHLLAVLNSLRISSNRVGASDLTSRTCKLAATYPLYRNFILYSSSHVWTNWQFFVFFLQKCARTSWGVMFDFTVQVWTTCFLKQWAFFRSEERL